ncbi:MAG: metalloregulator ArsR/SmtB family transcription factor [Phycisphaeraceae bacterium]|nr:metalloregulator ArsR/SmtB family transcription factor [Phycisphaerales bacterium]MCB9861087.1 metalloregulator ArsR/SmtB family transcription factor [Phycisphaeraceae bacterium]
MKQTEASHLLTEKLSQLADPTRLRLMCLLASAEVSVGEIAKALQLPQSTVSRQLKILAEGSWIHGRSAGTSTFYSLSVDDLDTDAAALWHTVSASAQSMPHVANDQHRLASIIAERKVDTATYFGREGEHWDQVRTELFGGTFAAESLLALIDPFWTVADIGCGTGNIAELLAPWVKQVVLIDQAEHMLEGAKVRLSAYPNVVFKQGSADAIPVDDASVDVAVLSLVLHHTDSPSDALHEARRILKPQGLLLVIDMVAHNREQMSRQMGHKHLGFDEPTFAQWCRDASFAPPIWRVLPCRDATSGPPLFTAIARAAE